MRRQEECGGDITSWGGGRRDQSEWRLRVTEMDQHRGAGSHGHLDISVTVSPGTIAVDTRVTRGHNNWPASVLCPGEKFCRILAARDYDRILLGSLLSPSACRFLFLSLSEARVKPQTFSRPQEMNNICPGSEAGDVNHRKPWIYWPCRMLREWADIITPWFLSTCQSGLRSVKLRDLKYSEPQNSCRGIFLFIRAALNGIGIVI